MEVDFQVRLSASCYPLETDCKNTTNLIMQFFADSVKSKQIYYYYSLLYFLKTYEARKYERQQERKQEREALKAKYHVNFVL